MSRIYIILLAIAVVMISFTGATFSIIGLSKLFAGAATSVIFMAAALEFAKLVVTGFLYRYWGHIPRMLRGYLASAVVLLVCITSMGIFGYLSSAYQQSSLNLHSEQIRIRSLEEDQRRIQSQISETQKFIDEIPSRFITRKLQARKEYEGENKRLRIKSEKIQDEMRTLRVAILGTEAKIGPIIYLAQAVGADPESCVKFLILLFVLVFDPLAVCLVFCLNLAIRLREKYRGNEVKISSHSLSTPVDHRFRKDRRLKKVA